MVQAKGTMGSLNFWFRRAPNTSFYCPCSETIIQRSQSWELKLRPRKNNNKRSMVSLPKWEYFYKTKGRKKKKPWKMSCFHHTGRDGIGIAGKSDWDDGRFINCWRRAPFAFFSLSACACNVKICICCLMNSEVPGLQVQWHASEKFVREEKDYIPHPQNSHDHFWTIYFIFFFFLLSLFLFVSDCT